MSQLPPRTYRGFELHSRQCVSCDNENPTCNCAADENCVLTSRTCSQCPAIQCNKKPNAGGGGVNPGVIAGPVVAILVIASLVLFWYLRRKKRRDLARLEELAARARKAEIAGFHLSQPGSPAPGSARSLPSARSNPRSSRQSQSALSQPPHSASGQRRSQRPPQKSKAEQYGESGSGHPDNGAGDPFTDNNGGDGGSFQTERSDGSMSTRIIPIQWTGPPLDGHGHGHGQENGEDERRRNGEAARKLNEARENLLRGGAPLRPARAPGLDLRLNGGAVPDGAEGDERSPAEAGGRIRDSFVSGTSGAPSFSSGYTTDLHTDAPKIFTSKHVQMGRFHQAEVVSFGQQQIQHPPSAPSGSGSGSVPGPQPMPDGNYRTLTPTSAERRYDDEAEEMPSPDPNHHPPPGVSPTDLRFSMGSLAYSESVSSMATDRYLARPDSTFGPVPPRAPWATGNGNGQMGRESMMSSRSEADSVLGGFPMIPPSGAYPSSNSHNHFPQSSSAATLDVAHFPRPEAPPSSSSASPATATAAAATTRTPPPPPPSYRASPSSTSGAKPRPTTSASIADSILGAFPFVPPNTDDLASLPSARIPETAGRTANPNSNPNSRMTAMSGVSEGLGGFEFRWGGEEEGEMVPPIPAGAGAGAGRSSLDHRATGR